MNLCFVFVFCFSVCLFFSKLVKVCLCFYTCCFDCKCKSLNRLGEHIFVFFKKRKQKDNKKRKASRKTLLQKTEILDIQPTNLREWISLRFRLGNNEFSEKNQQNRNSLFPSRNLRDVYSPSGRGLDIQHFCVLFYVFLEAFLLFFCFFMFVMFSPSLFKLLHLQSKKHI